MTVYNNDATPATAVAAFLSQFSISNTGAIRYVSGSHTFHTTWVHKALQHKVWDLVISGDDDVQLSDPNPSTTAALGSIIELLDHTGAGYAHRYNIDDTVATYLFGGSITQYDASGDVDAWYPLIMSGSAEAAVEAQVVQDEVQLTSHWGTGKNQTAPGVVNRILIRAITGGVLSDGGRVVVKAHDFNNVYSIWETTLGLTEQSSVVNALNDSFNNTLEATVAAYGITKSEGYKSLDLDGNGNKAYLGEWSYSPETTKGDLYEFVKWILGRDSAQTIYGVNSNVWTGRVFEVDVDAASGTGTFVQNETISWAGGAGNLVGMDDLDATAGVRMFIHLGTGVAPVDTETITGAGSATALVDTGGSTSLVTSPNLLGQYTGSWIGAFGAGFLQAQVTNTDSFTDLDGNVVSPPNFVGVSGTVECVNSADVPHVYLTIRDGSSPDYAQHTMNGAHSISDGVVTINGAIPSTTPLTGYIGLLSATGDNQVFYEYSSWTGSVFTLVGTLAEAYIDTDVVNVAYFYQAPVGGGTTKTLTRTVTYGGTPIPVIGWVRQGDEAAPDAVIPISGQIGAGGFTFSVTLEREV